MKLAKQFPPQCEGGNLALKPLEENNEAVVSRPEQLATDAPRARMLGLIDASKKGASTLGRRRAALQGKRRHVSPALAMRAVQAQRKR